MKKIPEISSGGKRIFFDPATGLLETPVFSLAPGELIGYSLGKPWRLNAVGTVPFRAAVEDGVLTLTGRDAFFAYRLTFSFDRHGLLRGGAAFTALRAVTDFCGTVSFPVPDDARFVMPMSLYNNNPSTAPDRVVPRFPAAGPASLVLEESRFPIPGVSAESGRGFVSFFVMPGRGCALGAERSAPGTTCCVITSGCVSFNGRHDEAYEFKCRSVPHAKGYRDLAAGAVFEICFALNRGETPRPGEGFRDLVRSGWKLYRPRSSAVLPLREVISRKMAALDRSWYSGGYSCVERLNLYDRKPCFLAGWTGQFCRMALCDIRYGCFHGEPERVARGLAAVGSFLARGRTRTRGLFYTTYDPESGRRGGCESVSGPGIPARALGETFSDIAGIMLFCREHGIACPGNFEPAVREYLDFVREHLLPEGVTPVVYREDGSASDEKASSAGTAAISCFLTMYELTGESGFLERGLALLEACWKLGGDRYATPFARATLDAGCEDKEAGCPFFTAAAQAWYLTGDPRHRHMAESCGDWLLTWVYFWSVPLRKDSVCRHFGFDTCGWPAVSVENQHLDVFFPAWEMFLFGVKSGDELFRKAGELVFRAWSHGISAGNGDWLMPFRGMQPEQFFQTDWRFSLSAAFDRFPKYFREQLGKFGYSAETIDERNLSGGCNPWLVSWITALVLNAALSFEEYAKTQGSVPRMGR